MQSNLPPLQDVHLAYMRTFNAELRTRRTATLLSQVISPISEAIRVHHFKDLIAILGTTASSSHPLRATDPHSNEALEAFLEIAGATIQLELKASEVLSLHATNEQVQRDLELALLAAHYVHAAVEEGGPNASTSQLQSLNQAVAQLSQSVDASILHLSKLRGYPDSQDRWRSMKKQISTSQRLPLPFKLPRFTNDKDFTNALQRLVDAHRRPADPRAEPSRANDSVPTFLNNAIEHAINPKARAQTVLSLTNLLVHRLTWTMGDALGRLRLVQNPQPIQIVEDQFLPELFFESPDQDTSTANSAAYKLHRHVDFELSDFAQRFVDGHVANGTWASGTENEATLLLKIHAFHAIDAMFNGNPRAEVLAFDALRTLVGLNDSWALAQYGIAPGLDGLKAVAPQRLNLPDNGPDPGPMTL